MQNRPTSSSKMVPPLGSRKRKRTVGFRATIRRQTTLPKDEKTPAMVTHDGGLKKNPAITYSRAIRTTIGPRCLTAVFGMGTGVTTWVWSPEDRSQGSTV